LAPAGAAQRFHVVLRFVTPVAVALVAGGVFAANARAQQIGATSVRGIVVSGGERVPYALVALLPSHGQRFADDSGAFVVTAVAPGRYRLRVRQIGYQPVDTTVTKVVGRPLEIVVTLERLAVELADITVTAPGRCTAPGPPDSAVSGDLAAVFEQLRQNAERYALLADSYPYRYRLARTFTDYDQAGMVLSTSSDTVEYQSNARARYQPGGVVGWGRGPRRTAVRVLNLPSLSDLADSSFQASHCFAYRGPEDRGGERLVRFTFQAAESERRPDIEGEVELEADTYRIRRAVIRLTHPGRALEGLQSATDTITYQELAPNIVLPGVVRGTLVAEPRFGVRRPVVRSAEEQRLIGVHFLRRLPGRPVPGP
jgi:hypothetical protein